MPMMRPRPTSPASRLIHASLEVKIESLPNRAHPQYQPCGEAIECLHGEERRDVEEVAGQQEVADADLRTQRGASSGPTRTPMKVTPAFSPFSVGSVPRCSRSRDSNGAPWPMLRPNTVTEVIAAASPQRRSLAVGVWRRPFASRACLDPFQGEQRTWSGTERPLYGRGDRAPFALIVAITACGTLGMHLIIPGTAGYRAGAAGIAGGDPAQHHALSGRAGDRAAGVWANLGPFRTAASATGGAGAVHAAGIATTVAPNAWLLVVARILQSIGACGGLVLGRAIVRDSATPDRAAAQLAMLTLVMSAAPAIAPVLGGYATAWFGWRAAFALLAIVGGGHLGAGGAAAAGDQRGAVQLAGFDAAGLAAAAAVSGVSRVHGRRGVYHHVVLCVHGGVAIHPGGPAA